MSDAALRWAARQRAGSPSAQIVLFILAERATPDGVVTQIAADELAEESQQPRRSVFRRLRDFERAGIFSREVADRLADGAPVVPGRLHFTRGLIVAREDDAS